MFSRAHVPEVWGEERRAEIERLVTEALAASAWQRPPSAARPLWVVHPGGAPEPRPAPMARERRGSRRWPWLLALVAIGVVGGLFVDGPARSRALAELRHVAALSRSTAELPTRPREQRSLGGGGGSRWTSGVRALEVSEPEPEPAASSAALVTSTRALPAGAKPPRAPAQRDARGAVDDTANPLETALESREPTARRSANVLDAAL